MTFEWVLPASRFSTERNNRFELSKMHVFFSLENKTQIFCSNRGVISVCRIENHGTNVERSGPGLLAGGDCRQHPIRDSQACETSFGDQLAELRGFSKVSQWAEWFVSILTWGQPRTGCFLEDSCRNSALQVKEMCRFQWQDDHLCGEEGQRLLYFVEGNCPNSLCEMWSLHESDRQLQIDKP